MSCNVEFQGNVATEVPKGLIVALMKSFNTADIGEKNKMLEVAPAFRVLCHCKFASAFTSTSGVPRGYQSGLFLIKSQKEIEVR